VIRQRVLSSVDVRADVPSASAKRDAQPAAHERAERFLRVHRGGHREKRERVLRNRAGDEEKTSRPLRERAARRGGAEPNDVRLEKREREFPERRARLSFALCVLCVLFVLFVCFARARSCSFGRGCDPGKDDRSSVDGRVVAFANEKGTTRKKPFDARRIERSRGRGGTPRRGGSERRDALFVYVFACGVASRSRGRRGCARGVSRTSPRGPRSHREADPFGHGISVPLAPSPRAEVTRTRGPRPRRPPKPHARHPPAADGTDGQPPQPPSSRV
jgi:hypothetical protein